MLFKVLIDRESPKGECGIECRVLYVENESALEMRLDNIISMMRNDGYRRATVVDCFNLNYPDVLQKVCR